ncbi:MAG TPA: hypothetical protein PK417_01370 [Hyphomonas sp.]|nr:hypothetical protein [Hyphomonas sp.]
MRIERSDLIGAGCAAAALALIAWLSLDSWAITRCEEFLATTDVNQTATYTPEEEACIRRRAPAPEAEN